MDYSGFEEETILLSKKEQAEVNNFSSTETSAIHSNILDNVNLNKKYRDYDSVFISLSCICLIFSLTVLVYVCKKCRKKSNNKIFYESKLHFLKAIQINLSLIASFFFLVRTTTTLMLNLAKHLTWINEIACNVVDIIALISFYNAEILLFSVIFVIHKITISQQALSVYNSKLVKASSFLALLSHTVIKIFHCTSYIIEANHKVVKNYGCVEKKKLTSYTEFHLTLNLLASILIMIIFFLCLYPLCCHLMSTKSVKIKNVQKTREKIKYKILKTLAVFVFYALSDSFMFSIVYSILNNFPDYAKHLLFDFCLVLQVLAVQITFSKSKFIIFCCSKNNIKNIQTTISSPTAIYNSYKKGRENKKNLAISLTDIHTSESDSKKSLTLSSYNSV